jgi:hypothetical protein
LSALRVLGHRAANQLTQACCHVFVGTSEAATDSIGNIFVSGNYSGMLDFGMGTITSKGVSDLFVAKLDPDGNPLWTRSFGDLSTDIWARSIQVDPTDGGVWLFGSYMGTVDFGGGPLHSTSTCMMPGEECFDAYLVKLDTDGNHLFSRQYGDSGDVVTGAAIGPDGSPVLTGMFKTNIDFGNNVSLMNDNYTDAFVAKLQ